MPRCFTAAASAHFIAFGTNCVVSLDLYSIFGVVDRGSFSGPACLFSLKLSVYVLKAGLQTYLHWFELNLVFQHVSPTLFMRKCVCVDVSCKPQYVLDRHGCTAYQHMQTGKARATQSYMKQQPATVVYCQEIGRAQLTGCLAK